MVHIATRFKVDDRVMHGDKPATVIDVESGRVEIPGMDKAEAFLIMYTIEHDAGGQDVVPTNALTEAKE